MKKILSIIAFLLVLVIISGCTYRKDYIKKYNKELHTVFGDFTYNYLGLEYDHGYDGLGAHNYKKWEIHFTDKYGNLKNAILVNDDGFDKQIEVIYEKVIERYLAKEIMNKYFNIEFEDEDTIYDEYRYTEYKTKKYNYSVLIGLRFDLTGYYDEKKHVINDYNFFNLTDVSLYKLIDEGIIKISYIYYKTSLDRVLSDFEHKTLLNYLIETTRSINKDIPINKAYYDLDKNSTNYKGEPYIDTVKTEFDF